MKKRLFHSALKIDFSKVVPGYCSNHFYKESQKEIKIGGDNRKKSFFPIISVPLFVNIGFFLGCSNLKQKRPCITQGWDMALIKAYTKPLHTSWSTLHALALVNIHIHTEEYR